MPPYPQRPSVAVVRVDSMGCPVTGETVTGLDVRRVRSEALNVIDGGLRAVYRTLELPGKHPLKDAHAALDAAVLDAYGFSARKDLLAQLLNLNRFVAAKATSAPSVSRLSFAEDREIGPTSTRSGQEGRQGSLGPCRF